MFNDSLGHHLDGMRKPAVTKVVHEPNLKDEELERRATKVYVCLLTPCSAHFYLPAAESQCPLFTLLLLTLIFFFCLFFIVGKYI